MPTRTAEDHFRYNYFSRALANLPDRFIRDGVYHIDVGCGAGVFSWALLDLMRECEIAYDNTILYGYDYCPTMIDIARMIRCILKEHIPDYPSISFDSDIDLFIETINTVGCLDQNILITFGYVLAGHHSLEDIRGFARIISHAVQSKTPNSTCILLSCDAISAPSSSAVCAGWSALRSSLAGLHISSNVITSIPIMTGSRVARLDRVSM